MDKMAIYDASRAVPEEATKQFSNGSFSGTDINPMWRIKKLTELFGPCGIGWYYDVVSERSEVHGDMTMAIVDLNLYIKVGENWSKPIYGTGGNQLVKMTKSGARPSDEGYKMALTDALSVACKALGIGADVYFSRDKTKYTQYAVSAPEAAADPGAKPDLPRPGAWNSTLALSAWCKDNGLMMETFGHLRKSLVDAGIVPDVKSHQMTPEQVDCLCNAIRANFPDLLTASA